MVENLRTNNLIRYVTKQYFNNFYHNHCKLIVAYDLIIKYYFHPVLYCMDNGLLQIGYQENL